MAALLILALAVALTLAPRPAFTQTLDISVQEMRSEKRVALVIGNSRYPTSPLRNPANDAQAMAQVLRELGFDIIARTDATEKDMKRAIEDFGDRLRNGGVGLFFYAGHGVQVGGRNYLVPTDAQIRTERDVDIEAIDVNRVLARMEEARNRLNIVVLDACRDNPFGRSFRSATRGLASIDAPSGTLIAYATAPGRVAADGSGQHSPYTEELVRAIRTPGLRIEEVFKRVRQSVSRTTGGQQVPWEASSLVGEFMFAMPASGATAMPRPQPPAVAAVPLPAPAEPKVRVVPRVGSLLIRSAKEPVEIWLGDRRIGDAGPGGDLEIELMAGAHVVRAKPRREGLKAWEKQIEVEPDKRGEVVVQVEPETKVAALPPSPPLPATPGGPSPSVGTARPGQPAKPKLVLTGHAEDVHSVAFSPDGRQIVSAAKGEIRLWDAISGGLLRVFQTTGYSKAAFAPDGRHIVYASSSVSGSEQVRLLDASTTQVIRTFQQTSYDFVAMSPDGRRLVTRQYAGGGLNLFDVGTGNIIRTLEMPRVPSTYAKSATFSPDGRYVAFATVFGTTTGGSAWDFRVWDIEKGAVRTFKTRTDIEVLSIAFSPDGRNLAVGTGTESPGTTGAVHLWDVTTGNQLRTFKIQFGVHGVAYSPDGRHVAAATNRITLWDAATGQRLGSFAPEGFVLGMNSVAFSSDGRRLASGGSEKTVHVWELDPAPAVAAPR